MKINLRSKPLIHIAVSMITLAAFVFISGCDLLLPPEPLPPTQTATQTATITATPDWFPATPTSTPVPGASPTPQPTTAQQREGITEQLVADDFTDETLWATFQRESGNIAFGNQNLTLAVARENTSLASISQHSLPENVYFELSIQPSLCQPADQAGITFWQLSEGNYYRLLMSCGGQYRLELIQNGQSTVIQDWDSATQMQFGAQATNRIGIWVYRGLFRLFINDAFQFEKGIAQNRSGALGVYARTITGNVMTIRFSDLKIFSVENN